jgi:hypothetical protein
VLCWCCCCCWRVVVCFFNSNQLNVLIWSV